MIDQGILDIGLAEGEAGLLEVLGVRTQHGHFAPFQPHRQYQAIETVVFRCTIPGLDKRLLEFLFDLFQLDSTFAVVPHTEIIDPDRAILAQHDAVRTPPQHAQSKMFQHRQHIGQRNIAVKPIQLETQGPGIIFQRTIQRY